MATDQIIIEFSADTSGLKPALDMLEQLGGVEASYAQKLKATNATLTERKRGFESNNQASKQMLATAEKLAPTLDKVADAMEEGVKIGYAKAMAESGVKVKELENELKRLQGSQSGVNESSKSLRGELRNMQAELAKLALEGKAGTDQYTQLRDEAGRLADAIGDASAEIRQAGSDTRGIDQAIRVTTTLTGAFTVAQGAAALFGDENEEVQKAILKVTAAMSILNGLQAISTELQRKDSLFTVAGAKAKGVYASATNLATTAVGRLRLSLIGLGIGAVVAAIGLLVANWDRLTNAITNTFPGLEKFGTKIRAIIQAVTDFIGLTSASARAVTAEAKSLELTNKQLERKAKLLEAEGKSIEAQKLRIQILQNELKILKLNNASATEQNDKINELQVARIKLNKSLEDSNTKTKENTRVTKENSKELATGLDLLRQKLSEIDKQISGLDPSKNAALIIALFGERKVIQEQITEAEKLLNVYQQIANFGRTENVVSIESITTGSIGNPREYEEIRRIREENEAERLRLAKRTTKEIAEDELKAAIEVGQKKRQQNQKEAEEKKRQAKETEEFIKSMSIDVAGELVSILAANRAADKQRQLDAELASISERRDKELSQENLTQEQRLAIQKKYAREEAIIKRKQFIADQNSRVAQVLLDGISATGRALVQFGAGTPAFFKALATIAATTGIAIGQIKSQKPPEIPAFKKGTRFGPGKVSLVGEEGPELKMVERGAKVYTADQTAKILETLGAFPGLADQALKGMLPKPVSMAKMQTIDGHSQSMNYDLMGKSIAKNLSFDRTNVSINADEKGFSTYLERGSYKAKIRNKRTTL